MFGKRKKAATAETTPPPQRPPVAKRKHVAWLRPDATEVEIQAVVDAVRKSGGM